jgi:hypothetical protein
MKAEEDHRATLRRKAAAMAVAIALADQSAAPPMFAPLPPPSDTWRAMSFFRASPERRVTLAHETK